jgi:hypothetical protein
MAQARHCMTILGIGHSLPRLDVAQMAPSKSNCCSYTLSSTRYHLVLFASPYSDFVTTFDALKFAI